MTYSTIVQCCWQIKYDFRWLQAPLQLKNYAKTDKTMKYQPLAAMNVSPLQLYYIIYIYILFKRYDF